MVDLRAICNIIDPNIDWSSKDLSHLTSIKLGINTSRRDLLIKTIKSDNWPTAVNPNMIVNTLEDRQKRANAIMTQFIRLNLKGLKVLDYGCGSGDCVTVASELGAIAVGYDIAENDEWKNQNGIFTTNFDKVVENGPYDVVLMYDVIDHMSHTDNQLWSLKKVLRPKTTIYARFHPFSSRHGGHAYLKFNKAYAHLFMNTKELEEVGATLEKTYTIINPDIVYKAMMERAGLTVTNQQIITVRPEPIIETFLPFIYPTWFKDYKISEPEKIIKIMSTQFVDYTMKLSNTR